MIPILNQNAVLCGKIQFCCLVCGKHFHTEEDATCHIAYRSHKKKLAKHGYIEPYIDDHIRRVRDGFYCEFCNKYLPPQSKIRPHTRDYMHLRYRGLHNLERVDNKIVSSKNVIITKEAWNGIIGHSCLICDAEIKDDIESHISSNEHLFKLVRTDVEFSINNGLYRTLKENCFHCLVCQEVFKNAARPFVNLHFTLPKHKLNIEEAAKSDVQNKKKKNAQPKERKDDQPNEKKDDKPNDKKDDQHNEKKDDKPNDKKDDQHNEKKDDKPNDKKDGKPKEKNDDQPNEKKDDQPNEEGCSGR